MKQLLSTLLLFCMLTIIVNTAQAQNWRIYYSSPTTIRVDSSSGGFAFLARAENSEVKAKGTKISFDFGNKSFLLTPAQVRKADNTTYGATVSTAIAAFISQADFASEQTVVVSTSTGTLDSLVYSVVELTNIHASVASSIVVGGNTVSIPAGGSVRFEAIRSPKTGRYKPVPRITYTATSSSLRIRTVKE